MLGDERAILNEEEHARGRGLEHFLHRAIQRADDEGQLLAAAHMRARMLHPAQQARRLRGDGKDVSIRILSRKLLDCEEANIRQMQQFL